MVPGHEYQAITNIPRVLLKVSQHEAALNVIESFVAQGPKVLIPELTVVRCEWLDDKDNALLIVIDPADSPYLGRMFISSPRTQGLFEINI